MAAHRAIHSIRWIAYAEPTNCAEVDRRDWPNDRWGRPLELTQAERQLQEITRRSTTVDALAWISEGRSISRPFDLPVLLNALAAVADQATDSNLAYLADCALNLVCRAEVRSDLDPSTELVALETIMRPTHYRAALDTLAARTASRTLRDVTLAAVSGAQADNPNVMPTLCAVAGLSYRDLKSRAAPVRPPGKVAARWQHGQLQAAFTVIDKIVKGGVASNTGVTRPMRPIEHLLPDVAMLTVRRSGGSAGHLWRSFGHVASLSRSSFRRGPSAALGARIATAHRILYKARSRRPCATFWPNEQFRSTACAATRHHVSCWPG